MKKKIAIVLSAIVMIGILAFGFIHSSVSQAAPSMSTGDVKELVSNQYPGEIADLQLRTEANNPIYEVEIIDTDYVYDLKLDGDSGEVLNITKKLNENNKYTNKDEQNKPEEKEDKEEQQEKEEKEEKKEKKETEDEIEPDKSHKENNETDQDNQNNEKQEEKEQEQADEENQDEQESEHQETQTVISPEEAGNIALEEFAGEIDDIDLEEDDGRTFYEVEIEREDQEAEIKIDAYTGEVLVIEIDD